MAHRLSSRSAWRPCVHTNRSCGGKPGRHSFQSPPGNGVKVPSAVASPTEGVGTSVHRGKLPKSRPLGDTAALVIMMLPEEATVIRSMTPGDPSTTKAVTTLARPRVGCWPGRSLLGRLTRSRDYEMTRKQLQTRRSREDQR